jgi:hypothetical protein
MVLKNNSPEATSRGMRARSTNGFRSARDFVSDRLHFAKGFLQKIIGGFQLCFK